MTTPAQEGPNPHRLKAVARFLATRLIALLVLGLIVFVALTDVGSLLRQVPWSDASPSQIESPDSTDPGWPHRRGPNYTAISDETDLANSWPNEGPPLLWSQPCGRGYSGVTIVGNRLFTQTQALKQAVECRDTETGTLVWRHRYDWAYESAGMYPGPRATPTWHERRVFFAGPDGQVGCLDATDGSQVWQVNVNEKFDGRGTGFGYSCSPLVENGKVILPVGGEGASVVALSADDGSTVWASGNEPASYCSALPFDFQGRRCVVAFLQNALALFDLETGKQLGLHPYSSGYDEHAAAPLYHEPYLMAASPFRAGAICYRLDALDLQPGKDGPAPIDLFPVWSNRRFSNDTASSVLVDGYVYGFDLREAQAKAQRPSRGKYKCLDFSTGDVLWETDQVGHATVLAADGKLFLFVDTGELILARASPDRFEELARTQVFEGEICWTAPALHRGRLFLRSPTQLACVYVARPEDLDRKQLETARPVAARTASHTFDLTWFVHVEREFLFDPADTEELWLWYRYSLIGVLGLATLAAAISYPLTAIRWLDTAPRVAPCGLLDHRLRPRHPPHAHLQSLDRRIHLHLAGLSLRRPPIGSQRGRLVKSSASTTPCPVLGAHQRRFLPRSLPGLLPRLPPAQPRHRMDLPPRLPSILADRRPNRLPFPLRFPPPDRPSLYPSLIHPLLLGGRSRADLEGSNAVIRLKGTPFTRTKKL